MVIEQGSLSQDCVNVFVGEFKSTPIFLSDDIALTMGISFVNEQASLVIRSFEDTKNRLMIELLLQADVLVDFVPDAVLPFLDEMNLVDVVQFLMDESVSVVGDWFKGFEDIRHEVGVIFVCPSVEAMESLGRQILNFKILSERLQEFGKEEVSVDLKLDFIRELLEDVLVIRMHDGEVLVILPFIVKEFFNSVLHPRFHIDLFVELVNQPKEPRQLISIIKVFIHLQERIRNLYEVTHQIGKDEDTKQKHHACVSCFPFVDWMEVTESHCGESRKEEVQHAQSSVSVAPAKEVLPEEVVADSEVCD